MDAVKKARCPESGKYYTYADYYTWNDSKRYELIVGTAYLMEPAPLFGRQGVSVELEYQMLYHLEYVYKYLHVQNL